MTIQTENLGKRFNREWIFKNLNFTFESGNIYAITGPNGSGKSTLLQVLWGQMPASSGSLAYRHEAKEIPAEEMFRHLAIATPYMDLIEEFTLEEMLHFHFKFKTIRENKSMDELIDIMQLGSSRGKAISNFSSGMRQRLKLALAFYSDVAVLYFDEPTTNLDRHFAKWYSRELSILPPDRLVFIASNQDHEYPESAKKLDIIDYK